MTNDCRLSYVDTKFLEPAVDVLVECRKVLAYTYAFAYYLATNNQKSILEDNQKDLELVTEDLTAALERDLGEHPFSDVNDVSEYKQKVQNHTRFYFCFFSYTQWNEQLRITLVLFFYSAPREFLVLWKS